jgi:cytidylate kinase
MTLKPGSASRIAVAIDGPAGAGKSTTARMLAERLGYVTVDSGAMYRAVGLYCRNHCIAASDADAVADATNSLEIAFVLPDGASEQQVLLNGVDISRAIRTPEIAQLASTVSTIPKVRESLVAKQRALGEAGGVVMEGRDIGTVVLPTAQVKIFLTAALDVRARRRFDEMVAKGTADDITFEQIRTDIAERDRRDTTRAVSPLRPADDAHTIESDAMTAEEVVDAILTLCRAAQTTAH